MRNVRGIDKDDSFNNVLTQKNLSNVKGVIIKRIYQLKNDIIFSEEKVVFYDKKTFAIKDYATRLQFLRDLVLDDELFDKELYNSILNKSRVLTEDEMLDRAKLIYDESMKKKAFNYISYFWNEALYDDNFFNEVYDSVEKNDASATKILKIKSLERRDVNEMVG